MVWAILPALFGVGLIVGFLSGLVGIGGGVLIVPFLYFFYAHPSWLGAPVPQDLHAAVAHATSLFIIVPTAVRGLLSYQRSGAIVWSAALPIALASMVAAVVGANVALLLPAALLKFVFGLLLIASAVQMVRRRVESVEGLPRRRMWIRSIVTGLLVGLLSAILGVGGGLIAIPMLIYVVGIGMHQVAATSLVVVAFAATSGVTTYMIRGWGVEGLPPGSLGYVHLLAALPMLAGSILSVRWGTVANQRLPARQLRWIFATLFGALGFELLVANIVALL